MHLEYEHPFIVANITNNGIPGTNFLRIHGGRTDFVENKFLLDGQPMKTRNGLDKSKCYRVSLAKQVVMSAGSCIVAPGKVLAGILPVGSWMVEGLYKPPRGIYVCWSEGAWLKKVEGRWTLRCLIPQKKRLH